MDNINVNDLKCSDYKNLVSDILFSLFLHTKNDYSGYAVITEDGDEEHRGEFYPKGTLVYNPEFLSFPIPKYKRLKWNELGILLDITPERYVSDGHICSKCPNYKDCHAFFKNDPEQLQCNYWKENVDNTVYLNNIKTAKDKIINGKD